MTGLPQVLDEAKRSNESVVKATPNIKAVGNGKFKGYLVLFGNDEERDFDGDFFTADTDYDIDFDNPAEAKSTVYFHHGFDPILGLKKLGNGVKAQLGIDDVGVWFEGILDERDDYERAIYRLIEDRKAGSSSGVPAHLVEYEQSGKGWHITRWPLGKDASITHMPNDWRQGLSVPILPAKSLPAVNVKSFLGGLPEDVSEAKAKDTSAQDMAEAGKSNPEENLMGTTPEQFDPQAFRSKLLGDIKSLLDSNADDDKQGNDANKGVFVTEDELDRRVKATIEEMNKGKVPLPSKKSSTQDDVDGDAQEVYTKAFMKHLAHGDKADITKAVKALEAGTDSEGGYAVPEVLNSTMIVPMRNKSILRLAGANVIPVRGTNSFKTNKIGFGAANDLVAEEGSFSENDPSLGQVEHVPYKNGHITKHSDELDEDSAWDVYNTMIAPNTSVVMSARENIWFTTGTGSGQPQGIITGAANGVTADATSAVTVDELIDLQESVDDLYQDGCVWMFNQTTRAALRKLAASDDRLLWNEGNIAAGIPQTLFGRPVRINNNVADMGASAKPILYGNLAYYFILDFGVSEDGNGSGIRYKRLNELYAGNGQVGHRFYRRVDGKVMLDEAIKVITMAAS